MATKQATSSSSSVAASSKKDDEINSSGGFPTYAVIAKEFHPFHRHDLNVLLHFFTTSLGVWGGLQLAVHCFPSNGPYGVYVYAALIGLTTPWLTSVLHTAFVYGCLQVSIATMQRLLHLDPILRALPIEESHIPIAVCLICIALGYGLQDLAHFLCQEATYMSSYMNGGKPYMLVLHTLWLWPLVMDACLMRSFFLPNIVSRNRCVVTTVASRKAVEDIRTWINQNIPSIPETTHVWPHKQVATDQATLQLEQDASIFAAFRKVFAAKHFDIQPIQDMNEIYVTAVGAKREINSDAVFYTPHCDGPYWFLPGASVYRVLVGLTPNQMVRTRFNLQHHESCDQVVDMYDVVGFDYNRELHWIDHVPGAKNTERRSLMKLHYVVYPKGWHSYGKLVANLNTTYNTWARGNFLRTLRPNGLYEHVLAWWIWLTTWTNAVWEEYFGWSNLVYIAASYALFSRPVFEILTSFRHYIVYMTTFAFRRQPPYQPVAHGYLMRDAKLYKTISLMHLARRLLPLLQWPRDVPVVALASIGFGTTILATARLGMVRTYFGSELGLVKPQWIHAFPYGTIPHPMIVGQLFAFSAILGWMGYYQHLLDVETMVLIGAHMACYTFHMVQEILDSSY